MAQVFACPICATFVAPCLPYLLSHLRLVHSHDPRFNVACGLDGCTYSARSFSALYSHIYRKHQASGAIQPRQQRDSSLRESNLLPANQTDGHVVCSSTDHESQDYHMQEDHFVQDDIDHLLGVDKENQQQSVAQFILKLKESKQVSQVVIDEIVDGFQSMFQYTVRRLRADVTAKLAAAGVDVNSILGLDDLFEQVPQPFEELETRHKQEKYFRETLGLVEPEEIRIGDPVHNPRFTGERREFSLKYDTYQYVPLLKSLRQLLRDPSVQNEINQCSKRIHSNGVLEDFCDGELFQSHPLFSQNPNALQIIAYFDEVELCNPLGTHVKKHKLGIVFFTLGNIHPKYRSSLRVIHLVLAVTTPIMEKYGMDLILQPFIRDLKILVSQGITMQIDGREHTYRGALIAFLADNLASHMLGGFKESFSFALRICRTCMVTRDQYKCTSNIAHIPQRSMSLHKEQCKLLSSPLGDHYSKTYGINRQSALLDIPHFSIFNGGLPHDVMHDVLEGVVVRELSLLLKHCISRKYLTLDEYNSRLLNFDYGYSESDKPAPVLRSSKFLETETKELKLTASQSLLLVRIFPLLLGDRVPDDDEFWQVYLILCTIVDILMCPWSSSDMCGYLAVLIQEHHASFIKVYTEEKITPKFHFLHHYPRQICMIGPMIRSWTMRHEAKLHFFKRVARLGNFKNIAFSLANRHQRLLCWELSTGNLLENPIECSPGQSLTELINESLPVKASIQLLFPNISDHTMVSRPSWVKRNGSLIKKGAYLITGSDGLHPVFGKVEELLVLSDALVLLVHTVKTLYFDDHYHAYVVTVTAEQSYLLFDSLESYAVLHAHQRDGLLYIYLKNFFEP